MSLDPLIKQAFAAVEAGDLATLEKLWQAGLLPTGKGFCDRTLLEHAALHSLKTIQWLVHGPPKLFPTNVDKDSFTEYLSSTIIYGPNNIDERLEMVEFLLDHGADPLAVLSYREQVWTVWHQAAKKAPTAIVRLLWDRCVKYAPFERTLLYPMKYNALHYSCRRGTGDPFRDWTPDTLNFLINGPPGLDVNQQDAVGCTALHLACQTVVGQYCVPWLLENTLCNFEILNKDGNTPLLLAISAPCGLKSAELLLERGAKLYDPEDPMRTSALHIACDSDYECFQFVVSHSLEYTQFLSDHINDRHHGKTALYIACKASNPRHRNNEKITYLCNLGADVNRPASDGRTPLMAAASNYDLSLVRLLVEKYGANVNAKTLVGDTAMSFAFSDDVKSYLRSKGGSDFNNFCFCF